MAPRMDFSSFYIYFVRLLLCNKHYEFILTFISIHSIIICVVFFGAYMRCTWLCPFNPGVTRVGRRAEHDCISLTGGVTHQWCGAFPLHLSSLSLDCGAPWQSVVSFPSLNSRTTSMAGECRNNPLNPL
jgi:hypothetical protein